MNARENTAPESYAMDYKALLSAARAESATNLALFLRTQLPFKWRDLYVAAVARPTNIVKFQSRSFESLLRPLFRYSELEITGEVPYDQTIENRVVAVLGTSARADEPRDGRRMRDWIEATEEFMGSNRDKGHFIAHCIGGRLGVNVFWQDRDLNRGWSPEGKIYRQMETYCYEHAGTFCFSRPVYTDGSMTRS